MSDMADARKTTDEMGLEISKSAYEAAIGRVVLEYIDKFKPYELSPVVESDALRTICRIRDILDDDDLGDPECFHRIDEIISELDQINLYTHRHDF